MDKKSEKEVNSNKVNNESYETPQKKRKVVNVPNAPKKLN
jgi:hypothetical protein